MCKYSIYIYIKICLDFVYCNKVKAKKKNVYIFN